MRAAVDLGASARPTRLHDLLAVHRTLMVRSPTPQVAGVVRAAQSWIGGSAYNPCAASYVPPPAEHVPPLLDDLVEYVNTDHHPALVQAALAHAQFEAIHPFADGNGRAGRALIHLILRRRGVAPRFVPPISLVLATWAPDYLAGLTAYRWVGAPDHAERGGHAHLWLRTFAAAAARACAGARSYARTISDLQHDWRRRLGRVRAASATALLLEALPGAPIITVDTAAALTGRSPMRVGEAVNRLHQAGILTQRNPHRQRYRSFESPEIIDLFTGLERALAAPAPDANRDDRPWSSPAARAGVALPRGGGGPRPTLQGRGPLRGGPAAPRR
ncbi:MAG: Fic family protein [Acidimicrobiales bacterium]